MATTREAVVVGAGIGGLAAATGLIHSGWQVHVLERADVLAPVGAGIALSPNAVKGLDWLGLGAQLRGRARAQGAVGLRTAAGRWLMRTNIESLTERFGVPAYALHRADLQQMLLDAAGDAEIRAGHHVTRVREDAGRVTVEFDVAGQRSELSADLVVAADGLRSTIRPLLFPDHPGPAPAGYVAWRSVVDEPPSTFDQDGSVTETWGRGHRFGVVPLADGRIYWFATAPDVPGGSPLDELATLRSRFGTWHHPIPQLLAATPPEALLRHDIHHLIDPLPTYAVGHVALLGDAAHAVTPDLGQGGALAIEDATELAAALAGGPDVPRALQAYDAARRPRTQALVRASARVARIAQVSNPVVAMARELAVRLIPNGLYLRTTEPALSWRPPRPLVQR